MATPYDPDGSGGHRGNIDEPMACRGNQGADPNARSNHVPSPSPSLYETIYYTRRWEGYLAETYHDPPLDGEFYWTIDDYAWVAWFRMRSDGSSQIYTSFTGTALAPGGDTCNPSGTNDALEVSAPGMTIQDSPVLRYGLYYSSSDELTTAIQIYLGPGVSNPVWTEYSVRGAFDPNGFGSQFAEDFGNVMNDVNPWNYIGSDGAAYFSLNVFGNINTGSWSPGSERRHL